MAWKNQWSSCQCYHYLIIFYRSNSCTDFGDLNVDIQISDWLEADNGDVHGANCWKYCLFDTFNQSSFVFLKYFHFSFFPHLNFCWSFLVFCNQNLFKKYGLQIILFDKRINFETPSGGGHLVGSLLLGSLGDWTCLKN